MRIRNSAVTEFQFNLKRHHLLTYNTLPHLDSAEFKDWVTYADQLNAVFSVSVSGGS